MKMEIKLAKYDSYKSSGVEWLGEIPKHWEALSNKYIFNLKKNLVGKKSKDYELLSLTLNGVIKRDMENPQGKFPAEFDTYQEVKKGDFIFCLFDVEETPRTVGLSDFDGMITGAYTVMQPNSDFDKSFLYYFYLNLDADKRMKPLYTGLRNTITKDNFFSFKTFSPPKEEQTAIAQFLDDKTTKIDQAIAQKEKQIELLKERRQILIHNAVTKGINPNVNLKYSGVEWIGEIPEGWEVKKNGYLARIIRGASPRPAGHPMYFNGINIPWIAVGDITKDENIYLDTAVNFLTEAGKKQSRFIKNGTFVLSNSGATLGVPKIMSISGCINDGVLAFIDLKENLINKIFLYYYFKSQTMRLRDEMNQGATQPNLNTNIVKQLPIALPPIIEQQKVIEYIETANSKISTAISLKEQEIEKLKEYKASLINSVVTGKVRVC
jgi:type I restriction enzyme S subunit